MKNQAKAGKNKCHPEFISGSTPIVIIQNKEEMLKQVQHDSRHGFTLIELLVVVLIIGILAAVAVPQYQQAVLKSRTVQLQTLADALATAQKVYYMEHGSYAEKFEDLDVSIPTGATITTLTTTSQQAKWPNGMIAYTLVNGFTTYVRNEKWRIGIYSLVTGPGHKCQSYNELADQVCLSLGGKYMGTACATTEDLAAGKHGCNIYSFQ